MAVLNGYSRGRQMAREVDVVVRPGASGPEVALTIIVAKNPHDDIVVPVSDLLKEIASQMASDSTRAVTVDAKQLLNLVSAALKN